MIRCWSILLCCAIAQPHVFCQTADAPAVPLKIDVVRGEGAINNIRKRVPAEAAVRVTDQAGKPVAGASVSFILPTEGASGVFSNGSQSITVPTDAAGTAAARVKPNSLTGRLEIRVNASHGGETARAVITQHNLVVPGAGGGSGKAVAILAILGGIAAGGAVAYTRTQRKAADPVATPVRPVPIVITPGPGNAGPPF